MDGSEPIGGESSIRNTSDVMYGDERHSSAITPACRLQTVMLALATASALAAAVWMATESGKGTKLLVCRRDKKVAERGSNANAGNALV